MFLCFGELGFKTAAVQFRFGELPKHAESAILQLIIARVPFVQRFIHPLRP
jgi:hypothetical protein